MVKDNLKYTPGWRDRKNEKLSAKIGARYVGIFKIILPIVAGICLLIIAIWPYIQAELKVDDAATRKIHRIIKSQPSIKNTGVKTEYISNDKKGRPYVVRAKLTMHNYPKIVDLIEPTGEFKLDQDGTVNFSANVGHYNKEKNHLRLTGNVHVATDKGYDLYTESADFDLKENSAEGNEAIYGTGSMGENISAEGFQITDKGDKVHFKGKTKIVMPPKGK